MISKGPPPTRLPTSSSSRVSTIHKHAFIQCDTVPLSPIAECSTSLFSKLGSSKAAKSGFKRFCGTMPQSNVLYYSTELLHVIHVPVCCMVNLSLQPQIECLENLVYLQTQLFFSIPHIRASLFYTHNASNNFTFPLPPEQE